MRLLLRLAAQIVITALGFILLFGVFGCAAWLFTGDENAFFVIVLFGAVVGALFGVGQVIIGAFGEGAPPEMSGQEVAKEVAEGLVTRAVPPLEPILFIGKFFHWLTTKDFKAQRPGRLRRSLVGAVVLAVVAFIFLAAVSAMIPPAPGRLTFWEAMLGVPVAALLGAVLGALSDSL